MSPTLDHHVGAGNEPMHAATSSRGWALLALLLLIPVPTVGVLCAMVWEPTRGTMLGQVIYGAAKVWILALPLIWRIWVERQPISLSPVRHGGLGAGLGFGAAIFMAIMLGYWLIGRHVIDAEALQATASLNGLDDLKVYLLLTFGYYTLLNALLEEYVWRWFVYRQCERLMPAAAAVVASAALFTLHHVIAIKAQMGWTPTLLASAGIFIGGCTWSWLYRRYRSIWPGYVSHMCADAAVFIVGCMLLFGR